MSVDEVLMWDGQVPEYKSAVSSLLSPDGNRRDWCNCCSARGLKSGCKREIGARSRRGPRGGKSVPSGQWTTCE